MSVTFSVFSETTEEPKEKVYLKDLYDLPEEYFEDDYQMGFVKKDENGFYEYRGTWPELNVANSNARALLDALGVENEELIGGFKQSQLGDFQQRVIRAMNSVSRIEPNTHESFQEGNFFHCGLDAECMHLYLEKLLTIINKAREVNGDITYA